jgi:hypothetical protein
MMMDTRKWTNLTAQLDTFGLKPDKAVTSFADIAQAAASFKPEGQFGQSLEGIASAKDVAGQIKARALSQTIGKAEQQEARSITARAWERVADGLEQTCDDLLEGMSSQVVEAFEVIAEAQRELGELTSDAAVNHGDLAPLKRAQAAHQTITTAQAIRSKITPVPRNPAEAVVMRPFALWHFAGLEAWQAYTRADATYEGDGLQWLGHVMSLDGITPTWTTTEEAEDEANRIGRLEQAERRGDKAGLTYDPSVQAFRVGDDAAMHI